MEIQGWGLSRSLILGGQKSMPNFQFPSWLANSFLPSFFLVGNELIYLDPHTTQVFVDSDENGAVDDHSFHCQQPPQRMKIMNLDPSVALVSIAMGCSEEVGNSPPQKGVPSSGNPT